MELLLQFSTYLCIASLLLIISSEANTDQIPKHYVVYMGSSSPNYRNGDDYRISESSHLELLSSVIPREEKKRVSLIHHFSHAMSGFSAMLTEREASALSGHDGVVSVFPDPILELHTTRSWDFLESDLGMKNNTSAAYQHQHFSTKTDIIIGIIDTG